MKKLTTCIVALAALLGGVLLAQDHDITGTWQGTLHGPKDVRIVLKVSKADAGGLKAVMFSIDEGGRPRAGSITVKGSTVKFATISGTYEGKLVNATHASITGFWIQGPRPVPLDLTLADNKTAWTIPEPLLPPKSMAEDVNPEFEVATIKPTKGTPFTIHPTASGLLIANNASLSYLIKFAYEVHPRQITKAPEWLEIEKYDLTAKPAKKGQSSLKQMRVMVRKLLADRFQLAFHIEKRDLPVYAITVAKTGAKLARNESNPNGNPGYGGGPTGMRVMNSTVTEFIGFVLNDALEKPVVDQTGLGVARYDFVLKWTPDAAQSRPAKTPPSAANPDAAPDIFAAMQQQLGLKLESTKAPVEVMVIDHVQRPSEN